MYNVEKLRSKVKKAYIAIQTNSESRIHEIEDVKSEWESEEFKKYRESFGKLSLMIPESIGLELFGHLTELVSCGTNFSALVITRQYTNPGIVKSLERMYMILPIMKEEENVINQHYSKLERKE